MKKIKKEKLFRKKRKKGASKRKTVKPQKPEIKVFSKKEKYHIIKMSNLS